MYMSKQGDLHVNSHDIPKNKKKRGRRKSVTRMEGKTGKKRRGEEEDKDGDVRRPRRRRGGWRGGEGGNQGEGVKKGNKGSR